MKYVKFRNTFCLRYCLFMSFHDLYFFENPVINVIKYSRRIILRMKGIEIENIKYKSTF